MEKKESFTREEIIETFRVLINNTDIRNVIIKTFENDDNFDCDNLLIGIGAAIGFVATYLGIDEEEFLDKKGIERRRN